MDTPSPLPPRFTFGRFTVTLSRRELLADGKPVELSGRNYDILIALIQADGRIVTKNELLERVWPGRVVDESNLQNGISLLRKALGADRELIRTIAGQGYQFVGVVQESPEPKPRSTNIPVQCAELVSREELLAGLSALIFEKRLITLCGAGGIGKTRVAIEVASRLVSRFADGVWLVDLATLSDPALVPVAVASALGLPPSAALPEPIARAIEHKQLLLVLDNCEHLIDAAARMVELVEGAGASIHVLCTSREPLKLEAEWVYQVPPLDVPAEDSGSLDEVLAAGAAQLFVLRARRARPDFEMRPGQAVALGAICRCLDGIPLAIELAAARATVLGVDEAALRLDDRFKLLVGGNRTALPRHRTLEATLDWSYTLLSDSDQRAFCRLSMFAGSFSLDAASALLGDPQ
jgi:DNA-binding winged helix-turn-helix (wHTH) protein